MNRYPSRPLVQAAIVALQSAVDRYTPPPGYQPPQSSGVDDAYVHGLLSYAHRLSYSSSAPLGYQPGQPLLFFRPPAPQEAEMRASQLHAFNSECSCPGTASSCVGNYAVQALHERPPSHGMAGGRA